MIRDTAKEDDDFVNTIMQALDRVEQERNMGSGGWNCWRNSTKWAPYGYTIN